VSQSIKRDNEWAATKELASNISGIFPGRFAEIGEKILSYLFKPPDSPLLLDRSRVVDDYKLAIDTTLAAESDDALSATVDHQLIEPSQDKISALELSLTPSILAPDTDSDARRSAEMDDLKDRQRRAIETIEQDLAARSAAGKASKSAQPDPAPNHEQSEGAASGEQNTDAAKTVESKDGKHSLKYELGEFQGASQLLTAILQLTNQKDAKQLALYSDSIVRFGKLYNDYFVEETIGPMAFAGGWATIVLGIMNSGAAEDERAAIFGGLKSLAESLNELRSLFVTGISQIDTKLDSIIGVQVVFGQDVDVQLGQLRDLSLQQLASIQGLSSKFSAAELDNAEQAYERVVLEENKSIVSKCALIGGSSQELDACKKQLYGTLFFGTRSGAEEAWKVTQAAAPNIYATRDAARYADAILTAFLHENAAPPEHRFISYAKLQQELPAGFVSPLMWLSTLREFKSQIVLAHLPIGDEDRQLLSEVANDGKVLQTVLGKVGKEGIKDAWAQYLEAVVALRQHGEKCIVV
jgi:hypothetical protein